MELLSLMAYLGPFSSAMGASFARFASVDHLSPDGCSKSWLLNSEG